MSFHSPSVWLLLLLPLLGVIWWRWLDRRNRTTVRFSSIQTFTRQPKSLRVHLRAALPVLRTLAVALLIICLARPQKGDEQTRVYAEGIAIQMVVDLSGSMEAMDFELDGRKVNRLTAVKKVSREFLLGNGLELNGRPDDLVGLVVFGSYPDSLAPLTLDHEMVLSLLEESESYSSVERQKQIVELANQHARVQVSDPAKARAIEAEYTRLAEEGGTAIGDAIALGVERLRGLDRDEKRGGQRKIKSKVMILLTDGAQTHGDLSPQQGAELAAELGIRIYSIGIGTTGRFQLPVVDRSGNVHYREPDNYQNYRIDEPTLKEVAEATRGQYFHARDTQSLRSVYAEIDALEKTETEEKRYKQYKEMATQSTTFGRFTVPPLIWGVLGLFALEVLLKNTLLRKIP